MKIHDLSICLIIRDEGDYLQEWLDWHVNAGVEHFYIYDNGSRPPITEFVPEQYRDYCTVLQAPEMFQVEAYTHCLSHYRQDSHWIAFIDTDEFIRIEDGRSIPEFLRNMPSEADAVALHWVVYGANGQRKNKCLGTRAIPNPSGHIPKSAADQVHCSPGTDQWNVSTLADRHTRTGSCREYAWRTSELVHERENHKRYCGCRPLLHPFT